MTQTGESFINEQNNKPELQTQQISNKINENPEYKSRIKDFAASIKNRKQLKKGVVSQETAPKETITPTITPTDDNTENTTVSNNTQQTPFSTIDTKEGLVYKKGEDLSPLQEIYEPVVALKKNVAGAVFELKQSAWSDNTLENDLNAAKEKLENKYIESKEYIDTSAESFNKIRNLVSQDENVKGTLKTVENKINDIVNGISSLSRVKDFPLKWKDSNGDMVITNGKSTITLPVLHIKDYTKDLETAYNTVTYAAANDGVVLTPEYLKEHIESFRDQSDDVINLFINECMYDVQQNQKRPMEKYIDFFPTLSYSQGYQNKNDSLLDVLTDTNIIDNALGYYMYGSGTEGRTAEDWKKFVEAANIIQAAANTFNNEGYNESLAGDYIVAKTYGKQYPMIQEAINTYENFNITNEEILNIGRMYSENINDMRDFVNEIGGASPDELQHIIRREAQNMVDQFRQEKLQEYVRKAYEEGREMSFSEREQFGTVYQKNGKRYKGGEEITEEQAQEERTFTQGIVDGVWEMSNLLDENAFDSEAFMNRPTVEAASKVLFDDINTAFHGMMYFTQGGLGFQLTTQIPVYGDAMMYLMDKTIEGGEVLATWLADQIGFAEGWSDDTLQKYEQSIGGLFGMLFMKTYHKQLKKFQKTALATALKEASVEYVKGIKDRLISPNEIQEIIRRTNQGETEIESALSPEATIKTPMFSREMWDRFKQTFNQVFQKELEKGAKQEGRKPGVVDKLYMKAKQLYSELQDKRREDIREKNKNMVENQKARQTKQTEQVIETTENIEQATNQPTEVIEGTERVGEVVEGVEKVQQAKQGVDEMVGGEAKTQIQNIKKAISSIYNIIKEFNGNRKKIAEEKRNERDKEQLAKELRENKFSNEDIELLENNPYTDILLDIVNRETKQTNKKGEVVEDTKETTEVQLEKDMKSDEIQREVLSEGFMRIQEYIDKVKEEKKRIGEVYENLSKTPNINTRGFAKSQELQELLDNFGLELSEKYNFDTKQTEYKISRKGGGETTDKQDAMIKYLNHILGIIGRRTISEQDAQALRTKFKYKDDTIGNYVGTFSNLLRGVFNKFLDKQQGAKTLREVDALYVDALERLDVFEELTSKDNEIKKQAKQKILNMSEAEIDMLNDIIPGIKEMVELSRKSPELVKKMREIKLKQKETRRWLGDPIRYFFVSAPAVGGFAAGGITGALLGSFVFKRSNALGNRIKSKIVGHTADLELWNKLVDNLKIGKTEKTKYKKEILDGIEKLREQKTSERSQKFEKTLQEVNEILIDKKADKIRAEQELKEEMEMHKKENERIEEQRKETPQTDTKGTKEEQIIKEPTEPTETTETTETTEPTKPTEPTENIKEIEQTKQEPTKEESVEDFVSSMMGKEEKKQTESQKVDLEKLPDSILNDLREDPNCPEEVRTRIEDILTKRMLNDIKRESQMGEKSLKVGVKDEVEFVRRAHELQEIEKNLGKVGRNKLGAEAKKRQETEFLKKKEAFIREIMDTYGLDQHQAYDKFLELEDKGIGEEQYAETSAKQTNQYSKEVKNEIKEMKKEWQSQREQEILNASAGKEEGKEYSQEAKEIADTIEKVSETMKEVEDEYVVEKLEQEGKDVTIENIESKKEEIKDSETTGDEVLDRIMGKTEEARQEKQEVINNEIKKKTKKKTKAEEVPTQQNERALEITEPETKAKKTTKKVPEYVSEKTSTYEWKGKENVEKFEEKFGDDPNLYEEDDFGENVGISKEAKLNNHVNQTFNKIESSDSAMTDDWYNEQVTKATETFNTNISYKDLNLKYFTTELNYQKGTGAPKDAKAQFDRNDIKISVGDKKNKYTVLHEVTHYLDYKSAKELGYDGTMPLSEIVTEEGFKSDNPLVNRFKTLVEEINTGDPAESFAEFGEKFGERTSGKSKKSKIPENSMNRFVDWLSDMADAREKGKLKDGTLEKTEGVDINYYKHFKTGIVDKTEAPQLKSEIERLYETYKEQRFPDNDASEVKMIEKMNSLIPKGVPYNTLTKTQQRFYGIKDQYVDYRVRKNGIKIVDYGDVLTKNAMVHNDGTGKKVKGTTVSLSRSFAPHVTGNLYNSLLADGYIVDFKTRKQWMSSL